MAVQITFSREANPNSTFLPFRTAFTVIRNQDLIRLPRQLSGFYTNCPYDGF